MLDMDGGRGDDEEWAELGSGPVVFLPIKLYDAARLGEHVMTKAQHSETLSSVSSFVFCYFRVLSKSFLLKLYPSSRDLMGYYRRNTFTN